MYRSLTAACHICLLISAAAASDKPAVPENDVRGAITRGLPYLEREGTAWMQHRQCLTCHHVPFMLWSFNAARAKGFAVDAKKLDTWYAWSANDSLSRRGLKLNDDIFALLKDDGLAAETLEKLKPLNNKLLAADKELLGVLSADESARYGAILIRHATIDNGAGWMQTAGGGLDTLAQLLLGRGVKAEGKWAEFMATTPAMLSRMQLPDGSWQMGGRLFAQKRERAEGNYVATAWVILALASLDKPETAVEESLKRALAFVKQGQPGASAESLIVTLLVEQHFGTTERRKELLNDLRKRQNADGGWAWLQGGASDAFATGQSLYALALCGVSADDETASRARGYLLSTQGQDGAWTVNPRSISGSANEGQMKKLEAIYSYWGSAWAVLGLLQTLPDAKSETAQNR